MALMLGGKLLSICSGQPAEEKEEDKSSTFKAQLVLANVVKSGTQDTEDDVVNQTIEILEKI